MKRRHTVPGGRPNFTTARQNVIVIDRRPNPRTVRRNRAAAAALGVALLAAGVLAPTARADGNEWNPCPPASPLCQDRSGKPGAVGQTEGLGRDIASDTVREARRRVRQEARREWRRALDRMFD